MLKELVRRNRSYRRFLPAEVSCDMLRELVDLARLSASGANRQPLKYLLSVEPDRNAAIFPHLRWAGYLTGWDGPEEGERPSAYILFLGDHEVAGAFGVDPGIAVQSILLGATERGLGGCIIASVDHDAVRRALDIPERYEILFVLALGRPGEEVRVEEVGADGDIRYWRDAEGVHHVPKRALDELIVG